MSEYVNSFIYALLHPFSLMLMGLLTHFCRKVVAAATHDTEHRPCITDYWKKNPIQTTMSVIGAIAGYAIFAHFPDFDKMAPEIQNVVRSTAFGIGFLADNVADAIGEKVTNKIKGG